MPNVRRLILVSMTGRSRVDHTKSLGLTIDAQLSWSKHVDEICKKVSSATGALKRARPFIPTDVAVHIYNALILPHFDYCSPVWDCMSGCSSDKILITKILLYFYFDFMCPRLYCIIFIFIFRLGASALAKLIK